MRVDREQVVGEREGVDKGGDAGQVKIGGVVRDKTEILEIISKV